MRKKLPPYLGPQPKPKMKPKPKGGASRKIKGGKVKPLDVFRVVLEADAGSDSSGGSGQCIHTYIRSLSKPQLSRLERLILSLKKRIFNGDKNKKNKERACDSVVEAIQEQMRRSASEELELKRQIIRKLRKLQIKKLKLSSAGILKTISVGSDRLEAKKFIDLFFSPELRKTEMLLEKGILVPYHKQHGPYAFISRIIGECLNT